LKPRYVGYNVLQLSSPGIFLCPFAGSLRFVVVRRLFFNNLFRPSLHNQEKTLKASRLAFFAFVFFSLGPFIPFKISSRPDKSSKIWFLDLACCGTPKEHHETEIYAF
jgi:hypothetical protein